MSSALIRLCYAAALGFAAPSVPALAGIDLVTEPAPPTDQIDLEIEDYIPLSGTSSGLGSDEKAKLMNACDQLAAHPGNDENPPGIKGVTYDKIVGRKALAACIEALDAVPDSQRMRYQLARAKQASGQGRDAIHDLTELAKDGYVAAINNLGATYQIGIGVRRDYAKALGWYEKAASKDFVPSMAILGWMYHSGLGTEKDETKAIEWYEKAADGGSGSAMHNLGHIYHRGAGVPANPEQAARWFRRSADAGFGRGMAMTAWTYQVGQGVPVDGEKAIEWYQKAIASGEVSAMTGLATLYDSGGSGIARQSDKAALWFVRALKKGHEPSRQRLIETPETLHRDTRREVQIQLNALGFDLGPADGVFGRNTRAAIQGAFKSP